MTTTQDRGLAVDRFGGPVVDPTKNVLDLVQAAIRRQDDLRDAEAKFQNAARDAETRRVNDLAALRVQYETIIENMRSAQTLTNSTLLATQLKEVKVDLSDRTSKLEQFRWETGGKSSGVGQFGSVIVQAITSLAGIIAIITAIFLTRH
jgi:hypothetical protein